MEEEAIRKLRDGATNKGRWKAIKYPKGWAQHGYSYVLLDPKTTADTSPLANADAALMAAAPALADRCLELHDLAVMLRDALKPYSDDYYSYSRDELIWTCRECGEPEYRAHDDICGIGQVLAKAKEVLGE
jgi:hypothetical protein